MILIGAKVAVGQTLELLRQQDRPTPSVRFRYQSIALSELAESGLEIKWELGVGMGVGRVSSGLRAGAAGKLYRTGESHSFAGELRIASGQVGHVGRGRSVPLEGRDLLGRTVVGTAEAEHGFSASPVVLGDSRIQLEFTSSEANVDDAGRIEFSNATTTLTVAAGETFAIGSLAQSSKIQQRGGKRYSTRVSSKDREQKRIFLLTADAEKP